MSTELDIPATDSNQFEFEPGVLLDSSCKSVIANGVSTMLQVVGDGVDAQGLLIGVRQLT